MTDLPNSMRAAAIDRFGGPELLTIHELPVPTVDAGEVLIALDFAGVGSWDPVVRTGDYPDYGQRFPLALGVDGAGTVAAIGAGVERFKIGDRVYSYSWDNPKGGFYAEYVAVDADRVGLVPEGLDLQQAGAIATTGLTALQGIDDALGVKQGMSVIVHGASGAVGTLAVQFAKLRGARVFAKASGEDGVALVRRLGADAAVDGRRQDILAAAREFAPGGVDAALAGGEGLERCLDALRPGGRCAYPEWVDNPLPQERPVIGIVPYDGLSAPREYKELGRAIMAAKLQVPIAATYSLEDAAKAHERIAAGHVLGKVVLRIR